MFSCWPADGSRSTINDISTVWLPAVAHYTQRIPQCMLPQKSCRWWFMFTPVSASTNHVGREQGTLSFCDALSHWVFHVSVLPGRDKSYNWQMTTSSLHDAPLRAFGYSRWSVRNDKIKVGGRLAAVEALRASTNNSSVCIFRLWETLKVNVRDILSLCWLVSDVSDQD